MADDQTTQDGIVVDKNKSPEQYIAEAEKKYIIPAIVREKFPDLIKLTYETESMNQEEREYWMQILPIMTEEQIVKYKEILVNEKDQLQKLDSDYKSQMADIEAKSTPLDEEALKAKMQQIKEAEAQSETAETQTEEELLKQLGQL